ncbi:hypothetical protein C8Q74DRAFT_1311022 [Fomes fomentarius]|nr:hypothetical protein C8Q74DRAFT_1311022 [Fomes fomentarius]
MFALPTSRIQFRVTRLLAHVSLHSMPRPVGCPGEQCVNARANSSLHHFDELVDYQSHLRPPGTSMDVPSFDHLPKVPGMPQGCAWGVFDKDGRKDLVGTLNHLTPQVVVSAAKEVRDGVSISLSWPMNAMPSPSFGMRSATVHTAQSLRSMGTPAEGWDDQLTFNTQSSSQWDSLVHFAHQPSGLSYNGTVCTQDALISPPPLSADPSAPTPPPTLEHWHARGCLVARGVLLDWARYAEAHDIAYSPYSDHAITVGELEAVAAFQGTDFRPGDVLLVRTGWTDAMTGKSALEQVQLLGGGISSGVEGSVAVARWIWDHRFSAVASDTISFECLPKHGADGKPWGPADLGESSHSCFILYLHR